MSPDRQSGFSLVEIIVALAVLSIAGIALMNAVTQSGRTAIVAREQSLAQVAAENLMNQFVLNLQPGGSISDQSGQYDMAGRTYDWVLEIGETSDPQFKQVTLSVSDDVGELYTLTTFRRTGPL